MKVMVVGKRGSVAHWMESVIPAVRVLGHQVAGFSTTGEGVMGRMQIRIVKRIDKQKMAAVMARQFEKAVMRFRPDLILVTHAFWAVPADIYELASKLSWRPVIVGWVGDKFAADQKHKAGLMDRLYFTDSGFLDSARQFGFKENYSYLPLAVDTSLFVPGTDDRIERMVFVANRTPHREQVVRQVTNRIDIFGPGWGRVDGIEQHAVYGHHVSIKKVAEFYRKYRAVLNVLNEMNLTHGLNQRNFEPMACGAIVVNEYGEDVEQCFVPGEEILVYRDADELNGIYDRLAGDRRWAETVARAGYERVMAEHTYVHRIKTILSDIE